MRFLRIPLDGLLSFESRNAIQQVDKGLGWKIQYTQQLRGNTDVRKPYPRPRGQPRGDATVP